MRTPAGKRPLDLGRRVEHADADALVAAHRAPDRARGDQADALVAEPQRRRRVALAPAHRRDAAVAAEAVAQQRERIGVASRLARVAEDGGDDGHAVARGRADEHVAGVDVWPVLTPLTTATLRTSTLRLTIAARARARAQRRARQVGDLAEERVAAQDQRQLDQVLGARVVARLVEADRVGVVRVVETELLGARAFMSRTKPRARAADADRERGRGVVRAGEQQAAQEIGDAHALARAQPDDRLDGQRAVARGGDAVRSGACARASRARSSAWSCWRSSAGRARRAPDDVARGRLDEDRRGRAHAGAAAAAGRATRRARARAPPRGRPSRSGRPRSRGQPDPLTGLQRVEVEPRVELPQARERHAGPVGDRRERVARTHDVASPASLGVAVLGDRACLGRLGAGAGAAGPRPLRA